MNRGIKKMAIQKYVKGEDLKKLIDDKLINTNGVKHILKKKGILPVCNSANSLSVLIHQHLFGSYTMSEMHDVMNLEQDNLKSTVVVLNPKKNDPKNDFLTQMADEFVNKGRIPNSKYELKNIVKNESNVTFQYTFNKPQKGKIRLAESKTVTLDVSITQLEDKQYKVNIRHEGMSESKQFISLLNDMIQTDVEKQIFGIRRITLASLKRSNKVDFFDLFGSYKHTDWQLINIINVTVNKSESVIDDESDDSISEELNANEATGRLTGISTAILKGNGLRNNDFVKECMDQGFIFSSMWYKFSHRFLPIVIDIDVNFKQTDLKINIVKTYISEDDGKEHPTQLPSSDQGQYIDYFQNIAYKVYSSLLDKQKAELKTERLD